ncbi:hypothetical protein BDY17DRAFT_290689, partial [Neohortaea acidophila]
MAPRTRPARASKPTPKVAAAVATAPTAPTAPLPSKRKSSKQGSRQAPSKARRRTTDASTAATAAAAAAAATTTARSKTKDAPAAPTAAASRSMDASAAAAVDDSLLNEIEAADTGLDGFQSLHDSEAEPEVVDLTVDPSTFEYELVWRVLAGRTQQQREIAYKRKTCKGNQPVYHMAQAWAAQQAGNLKIYRLSATASYEDQPAKKQYKTDIEYLHEFEELLARLISWQKHGWTEPCITMLWFCERDQVSTVLASSSPAAASSQRRRTATTRQEALVPSQIEEMESQGDYSASLRLEWTCTQQACPNYGDGKNGYCYWRNTNVPDNHCPFTKDIFAEWATEIKAGNLDARVPNLDIHSALHKSQARMRLKSSNHKKLEPPPSRSPERRGREPWPPYYFPYPPPGMGPPYTPAAGAIPEPPSSQPSSSAPSERVDRFLDWCAERDSWRGFGADLDRMRL